MAVTLSRELERLTHSGLELADPSMDVRDREVRDRDGEHVGSVADVLIDPDQRQVRMLEVRANGGLLGLGKKCYLIPVEAVAGGDPRTVYVSKPHDEITSAGEYQPADGDAEEAQYLAAYQAYGVTPYWANGGRESA